MPSNRPTSLNPATIEYIDDSVSSAQRSLANLHGEWNNILGRRGRGEIDEFRFIQERNTIRQEAEVRGWSFRDVERGYLEPRAPQMPDAPPTSPYPTITATQVREYERTIRYDSALHGIRSSLSPRLRGPGNGRQLEEPAWKKFPCVLNSDYRQTGKTTKLIEEMIAIEDLDCFFITPYGKNASISAISDVFEKKKIPYEHVSSKGAVKRKDTGQHYYVHAFHPDLIEKLRGRNDNGVPIFIDDLDKCLQAFFGRNTVVSLSWTLKQ